MSTLWRWLIYGVPGATMVAALKKSAALSRWTTARVRWWRKHWAIAAVGVLALLVFQQVLAARRHPGTPSSLIFVLCLATLLLALSRAAVERTLVRIRDAFVG